MFALFSFMYVSLEKNKKKQKKAYLKKFSQIDSDKHQKKKNKL